MTTTARLALPLAPGPRGVPLLGNALEAWKNPLDLFARGIREHGDIVRFKLGPFRYLLLNDVDAVKHVLVDNAKNYTKSRNYKGLKLVLGEGLLTSEGDFWKRQRRLVQPAFHRDRLAGFVDTMATATTAALERWEPKVGTTFDVHAEMMRLTFHIVGLTLLGANLVDEADAFGKALTTALEFANDYAEAAMPLPPWVPTPRNIEFKRALKTLDDLVLRVIAERRRSAREENDLLGMLMAVKDEEAGEGAAHTGMTDRQLRDEIMTLVLAGHETTANALTWTWYLLSKHPDIARRVKREVDEVLGGRTPGLPDLAKLVYTRQVIDESMRLYPPAWAFERQAIEDDEVKGFAVPKGTLIGICPFTLHRNVAYWSNPEGFDPDRFAPNASEKTERPRWAYLPFGGGPRMCVGSAFATMEAQLVLAMFAGRYRLDLPAGTNVEMIPAVTLRPRGGLPMALKAQRGAAEVTNRESGVAAGAREQLGLQRRESRRHADRVEGGLAKPAMPVAES
jgi:cytochrome P450